MNEEEKVAEVKPEKKKETKGSPKWLYAVIVIVVVVVIAGAWWMTREEETTDSVSTEDVTQTASKAPKHADWQKFTSSKYGFTMYYPTDYTLAESAVGTITLSKGSAVMVDLYVTVAGTSGDQVAKAVAPYMDDTRGYMTGASEVDTTIAGDIEATMVTGTLGAKAGITPQTGKKGSTIFFVRDGNLFALDSFYNDNVADFQIFEDILADMSF